MDRSADTDGSTAASRPRQPTLALPQGVLDVIVGAALAGFAAWLWVGSYDIEESGNELMGAAGFPRGVAIVLGATSLIIIIEAIAGIVSRGRTVPGIPVTFRRPLALVGSIVLMIAYPLLLARFGFYATTGVWLLALLAVAGYRRPIPALLTVVGFLAVVKLAFQMALGIPLP